MGKLRLIRKNGGYCFPEFITHTVQILFMRFFNKPADCPGIQRIHIGFVIVPGAFSGDFFIQIPDVASCFPFLQLAVLLQAAVLQRDIITGKKRSVPLYGSLAGGIKTFLLPFPLFIGKRSENQISAAVFHILCHLSSGRAGRPAILVIQIGVHAVFLCLIHTGAHAGLILIAQIGRVQTRTAMHMKTTDPHFLEIIDVLYQHFRRKRLVPRPERCPSVFICWILEQFSTQAFFFFFWI